MNSKQVITAGKNLEEASKVLILLHGRGASPQDILSIARHLNVQDYALIAPAAANRTWYPYSFLAPRLENEPSLSSSLKQIGDVVEDVLKEGISKENIYFLGFSQGACLALEFASTNATQWGGIAAFTGGLIGDKINTDNYKGDFSGTPIFIGSSDPDPHVPVERVLETTKVLKAMKAIVNIEIYKGMAHTISMDEIEKANKYVFDRIRVGI